MLALLLSTHIAHATPTKDAQAHVTQAKHTLAQARQELKAAKLQAKLEKRAKSKARTIQRAKARLAKLQPAYTATISEDSEPEGEPTWSKPDEGTCQRIALKGESWEDACERVFSIAPDRWTADGHLTVTTDPAGY